MREASKRIATDNGSSRTATDHLKGLAILVVMMNHYHNNYYNLGMVGYAHGVISIFFVLSGYGNFHSLDNSDASLGDTAGSFLIKRLVRIFSLCWVYLFICVVGGNKLSVLKIFAIDSSGAWFVPAILICYLVAVPLFEMLKRVRVPLYVALVVTFSAVGHYILTVLDVGVPSRVSEYVVDTAECILAT